MLIFSDFIQVFVVNKKEKKKKKKKKHIKVLDILLLRKKSAVRFISLAL